MAKVDLKLDIAYVEDVTRFKVVKGTVLGLILRREESDYQGPVDYAATGDPILDIASSPETDEVVAITAKEAGLSRFFFIQKAESGFSSIKELRIEVVPAIVDPAVNLGLTAEVIDKNL